MFKCYASRAHPVSGESETWPSEIDSLLSISPIPVGSVCISPEPQNCMTPLDQGLWEPRCNLQSESPHFLPYGLICLNYLDR